MNPLLRYLEDDVLFHLSLSRKGNDLKARFGDVKFVCMASTVRCMKDFAQRVAKELKLAGNWDSTDLAAGAARYCMFKVGPVLCVNHGIGYPSISTVLTEVIKLLYYAEVKEPIILKIGTCGSLDEPVGTVVITDSVVNDYFEMDARIPILGKQTYRPALVDQKLANEIKSVADKVVKFPFIMGKTMSQEYLYETLGKKNNVICDVTDEKRNEYVKKMKQYKIKNLDMESLILFATTHRLSIKAACITVVTNNVLADVMETINPEQLLVWESRPQVVIMEYIKHYLKSSRS